MQDQQEQVEQVVVEQEVLMQLEHQEQLTLEEVLEVVAEVVAEVQVDQVLLLLELQDQLIFQQVQAQIL
jgi:hypothetical protein